MINPTVRNSVFLRAVVVLLSLTAAAVTNAQNVTVTAANASNDAIYDVTFSGGGGNITVLNTDEGSLHHIVSLAFVPNTATFALDLLAADNQGGTIVRYPGDFHPGDATTGTVVFSSSGPGPAYPDGLSVDSAGDLYVVNSSPGSASNPQLWVLPSNGTGGFASPQLIDATSYVSTETLVDTLVATTTIVPPGGNQPVVYPGDLLVVTNNPSVVLRYPGANGDGPLTANSSPQVLITLPAGSSPGGLAFWPADNSLLVTTARGTIYQYHLTPNETPAIFASGLGNGQFKVRTGIQAGQPYAFVANNNGGDILQFSGPNQLVATVTAGVQHPQGLAVTNVAYAALSTCQDQQTEGCDLLGGQVITHNVPPNLSLFGNVLEDICVVPVDPRLVQPGSRCTTSLPVSTVCGSFGSTAIIPATFCGASGPTGKGFALVKTLTQAYAPPHTFPFNGAVVANDSNLADVLPPAPTNPDCNPSGPGITPLGTLAWAPLQGEGVVAEGNNLVDITGGCDGSAGHSYGLSLFAVGLALNTDDLTGYAASKYTSLLTTIQAESSPAEGALPAPVPPSTTPPDGNFTYQLQQCISTSQAAFAAGNLFYGGAANEALAADQQVAAVAGLSAPFTPVSDYPNPSGALRSRLQNIYYTINTRISGNQSAAAPPSPPPPPPPPTIAGTPITKAKAGTLYSFQPSAADFAGNTGTLTFSIVGQPSWATFSTTSGLLSGTAVKGTYNGIVISVTDGCASASLPAFSIKVN